MQPSPSRQKTFVMWIAVFVLGIVLGALVFGRGGNGRADSPPQAEVETVWTCSMHPQIKLPQFGPCPICGMDLIPLELDDMGSTPPNAYSMSANAMALADIETRAVTREFVEAELRTVGKVAIDERRMKKITAWVGGRLDRAYVDYTGITVNAGDHLVDLYSPVLYSAQVELIEALKASKELQGSSAEFIRSSAEATVAAAREKLRLLGLSASQIREVEEQTGPRDHVTINAPISGVVVERMAVEGEYVMTGSPIYTIAELDHVWILLDVYESDLDWVRFGQRVDFEVEAYPGEQFSGRVAFINPVVDPHSRTVKVRVNSENPGLRLKPDMFVRAVIRPQLLADGRAVDPDLAGKWVSPMHPEVVKDRPGSCDVCGMALVRAEDLGFVGGRGDEGPPLVIPASAPLLTGKRAVVYVKLPDIERPTFEGREVVLGPRTAEFYVVESGLAEGEEVVVKGAFKIDSAMQIQAKPSMMSPGGIPSHATGTTTPPVVQFSVSPEFRTSVIPFVDTYLALQTALAADDPDGAARAGEALSGFFAAISAETLNDEALAHWKVIQPQLASAVKSLEGAKTLESQRPAFKPLSDAVRAALQAYPVSSGLHSVFCPMAFNNEGAAWVQSGVEVRNPYFGAAMLRCGDLKEALPEAKL